MLVNAEPVPHIPVSSLVHIPFLAHLTHEFLPHKFYVLHLQLQLFYYSSFKANISVLNKKRYAILEFRQRKSQTRPGLTFPLLFVQNQG